MDILGDHVELIEFIIPLPICFIKKNCLNSNVRLLIFRENLNFEIIQGWIFFLYNNILTKFYSLFYFREILKIKFMKLVVKIWWFNVQDNSRKVIC